MSEPSIFLATPCFGGEVASKGMMSVIALMRTAEKRGIDVHPCHQPGMSIISLVAITSSRRFWRAGALTFFSWTLTLSFAPRTCLGW
jgi:hypothetical protein